MATPEEEAANKIWLAMGIDPPASAEVGEPDGAKKGGEVARQWRTINLIALTGLLFFCLGVLFASPHLLGRLLPPVEPYRYEHIGENLLRISKKDGRTEILRSGGWTPMPESRP